MSEEDYEFVYSKCIKPSLDSMVGIWTGRLVSDSMWSDPVFWFRYYFDKDIKGNKLLRNDYVFGNVLAGKAQVIDKEDHLEMEDATGGLFHDEIRSVNANICVGKYYSADNSILDWLPHGPSFLHVDSTRNSLYLLYVLTRVGQAAAYRNGVG